jgi:hypothetical protein
MAERLQRSERHVKRLLRALEAAGLLLGFDVIDRQIGRTRASAYWFPIDGRPSDDAVATYERKVGGRVTPRSPSEGDTRVTLEGDAGVMGRVTPVSPLELPLDPKFANAHLAGACADEPGEGVEEGPDPLWSGFEAMERAYPAEGLVFTDRAEAWTAYQDQVAAGAAAQDLEAAAAGYGPLLAKLRRTQGPVSLQRFLREGRWRGCLGDRPQASGAPGSPEPLAEVSAAIREAMGPKWPEVLLQDASWDEARRTVVCGSDRRADRLREAMRAKFEDMGVRVEGPAASSLAAE